MAIHLSEEGGGHMVTCDRGDHESWWATRGAAETAAREHAKKHKTTEEAT